MCCPCSTQLRCEHDKCRLIQRHATQAERLAFTRPSGPARGPIDCADARPYAVPPVSTMSRDARTTRSAGCTNRAPDLARRCRNYARSERGIGH